MQITYLTQITVCFIHQTNNVQTYIYTSSWLSAASHTLSLRVRNSLWAVDTSALAASTLSCTVSSSFCRSSCSSRTALAPISRAAFLPSAIAISCSKRCCQFSTATSCTGFKGSTSRYTVARQTAVPLLLPIMLFLFDRAAAGFLKVMTSVQTSLLLFALDLCQLPFRHCKDIHRCAADIYHIYLNAKPYNV